MGFHNLPLYGDADLGSAVESAEKAIAKIKSNKFDKKDVIALAEALEVVKNAVDDYE